MGPYRPWLWRDIISEESRTRRKLERLTKAELIDEVRNLERRLAVLQGSPLGGADSDPGAYLQAIVENLPGAVFRRILHPDGRITFPYVSAGIGDILGFDPVDIIANPERLIDTVHPDEKSMWLDVVRASARTLEPYDLEYRRLTATGETRWMRSIGRPRREADGSVVWDGITLDIDRQKAAEETLRASEERHRTFFEHSPTGIWEEDYSGAKAIIGQLREAGVTDFRRYFREHPDRLAEIVLAIKVVGVNQAGVAQYGLKTKEQYIAYDDDFEQWFDSGWNDFYIDELAAFAAGATTYAGEYRDRKADGTPFTAWTVSHMLGGHEGDWSSVITNAQDVTELKQAVEALREGQTLLDQAADMAKLGHWVRDETIDRCVYCSEALARMSGVTVQAYLDRYATMDALLEEIHPDDRDRYRRVIEEARREAKPYDLEFRDASPGGGYRYLRERGEPVLDADGRLARTVGTLQDVTDYKHAQLALEASHEELEQRIVERTTELAESESRFRAVVENLPHAIYLKDVEGRYLIINRRCMEWYGVSPETAIGKTHSELYAHEIDAGITHDLRDEEVLRTRGIVEWETEFLHADGIMHPTWAIKIPVFDEHGAIVAICGINTDITERKRTEQALRESERRYRELIEIMPTGVFVSAAGEVRFANPAAAEMFGARSPSDLVGKSIFDFVRPDFLDAVRARYDRIIGERQSQPVMEQVYVGIDGREFSVEAQAAPIIYEGRNAALSVFRDITQRKQAQEALDDSRRELAEKSRLLEATLESIDQGLIVFDENLRTLVWNERVRDFYGYPENMPNSETTLADLLRHSARRGVYGEGDPDEIARRLNKQAMGSGPLQAHRTMPDGRVVDLRRNPMPSGGFVTTYTDITEAKRTEQALREREALLHQAQSLAKIGVFIWDEIEDHCTFATQELADLFGTTIDDVLGRPGHDAKTLELIDPEDRARYITEIARAVEERKPYSVEFRIRDMKGNRRILCETGDPVLDENGRLVQTFGTVQDITDMRRAEKALRRSEESLANAQRIARLGNWDWNITSGLLYWSDEACRIFGYVPGEQPVTHDLFLSCLHPDDRSRVVEIGEKALETRAGYDAEYRILRPGGEERFLHEQAEIEVDDQGRPIRMRGTVHDVTERRMLEEQLRQAQKMEAIGKLTGGIAHDFNNLLLAVTLNLELLRDRVDDETLAEEFVDSSLHSVDKAAELTRRLLAFARKQPLRPTSIDIARLSDGVTGLLSRTLGENYLVATDIAPDLWLARADAAQVESALLNLAINARDAMPGGGTVRLAASNVTLGQDGADTRELSVGDYVALTVADDGIGMSLEVLEKAFDPFFTTKGIGEGTGLGLSMVYGFARQSGGDASIESEPGKGCRVTIYLPRAGSEAADGNDDEPPATSAGGTAPYDQARVARNQS